MKKILALALCLALLLGCAAALAETAEKEYSGELTIDERFTIKWVAPEGYEMSADSAGNPGSMIAVLTSDDESKPMMTVSIAYNELYSEIDRINDLDDAALAEIENTFKAEDEVEISYMETAYGTRLMMVRETKDDVDYVDFYTIYKGYEIEFVIVQTTENSALSITDEQIQTAIKFLSDMDFVSVE